MFHMLVIYYEQLRALGILDSIRARQLGYSRRLKFAEFLRRFAQQTIKRLHFNILPLHIIQRDL